MVAGPGADEGRGGKPQGRVGGHGPPRWDGGVLRVATRGSPLALRQAEEVIRRLREACPGLEVRVVEIRTRGDRDQRPLRAFGRPGVFVREVERALLSGEADLAVHSLKDLPTALPRGLIVAAFPVRADPRDALVSPRGLSLEELPAGARLATGSPRRRALIARVRPDITCVDVRGNVDTRVRRAQEAGLDGLVLAAAGLDRLGLGHLVTQRLSPETFVPAPGQGTLAVEARVWDEDLLALLAGIDRPELRAASEAERSFLRTLGTGCQLPAGAWARVEGGVLRLVGMLAGGETGPVFADALEGSAADAVRLGQELAGLLLRRARHPAPAP